jgi:membrane protease subunit (stomatin/prohibitin family)
MDARQTLHVTFRREWRSWLSAVRKETRNGETVSVATSPAGAKAETQPETEPAPAAGDMKFCRNCGAKIPKESKFCESCGTNLGA